MNVTVCIIILIIYIYESNCLYLWLTMVHLSSAWLRAKRQAGGGPGNHASPGGDPIVALVCSFPYPGAIG